MKKFLTLLLALGAIATFPSCVSMKHVTQNKNAGDKWLASQSQARPKVNVSGNWISDQWGGATFNQTGNKVTGTLGGYKVHGVVYGTRVYLLAAGRVLSDYTIIMNPDATGDMLEGGYSDSIPFSLEDAEPIILNKIQM